MQRRFLRLVASLQCAQVRPAAGHVRERRIQLARIRIDLIRRPNQLRRHVRIKAEQSAQIVLGLIGLALGVGQFAANIGAGTQAAAGAVIGQVTSGQRALDRGLQRRQRSAFLTQTRDLRTQIVDLVEQLARLGDGLPFVPEQIQMHAACLARCRGRARRMGE